MVRSITTANEEQTHLRNDSMTSQDAWIDDYDKEQQPKSEEEQQQQSRGQVPEYREWSVRKENAPLADIPLIRVAGDALGLESRSSVIGKTEDLANIVDLAVGILKSTDEEAVYKFLRHQMRKTQTGSYGHSMRSLLLHLREISEELTY